MKVGNALADFIVDCDKSSLGAHTFFDRAAQKFCVRKKRSGQAVRQIHQRLVMGPGDQQAVALKERAVVQKGDAGFIIEHDGGEQFA